MTLFLLILFIYVCLGMAATAFTQKWFDEIMDEHDANASLRTIVRTFLVIAWLPMAISIVFLAFKDWRATIKENK